MGNTWEIHVLKYMGNTLISKYKGNTWDMSKYMGNTWEIHGHFTSVPPEEQAEIDEYE